MVICITKAWSRSCFRQTTPAWCVPRAVELTFSYDLVDLVGTVKSALDLRVGEQVGYDLGWTSAGLRVTKIKTYR